MFIIYGIFHSIDFFFFLFLYIAPHFSLNLYFSIQEEDFEAFADCDQEAECFRNLTDDEICASVKLNRQGMDDLEEEEDKEEAGIADESIPGVSHKDALMHLSMVRKYLEQNFTEYNSYYDIEEMIEKNALTNRTRSKITDFFK